MDTSSGGSDGEHSRQLLPSTVTSSVFPTGVVGALSDRNQGTMSPQVFGGNNSSAHDTMAGGNDDTNSSDDSGAASLTSKNTPIFLRFAQVKGSLEEVEQIVNEADMITAVEFDETGRFLATGDKGGRIVVFERVNDAILSSTVGDFTGANGRRNRRRSNNHTDDDDEMMDTDNVAIVAPINKTISGGDRDATYISMHRTSSASLATTTSLADYNVYTTFQSHQPEFDYLKSVEIEEKINQIKWLKQRSPARFLLSTNDKTVKLWKLVERHKIASGFNFSDDTDLNELYEDFFGNNNTVIDKGSSINSSSAMVIVNDSNIRSVSGGDSDMPGASPMSQNPFHYRGLEGTHALCVENLSDRTHKHFIISVRQQTLRRRRLSRIRVPQFSHRPHGQVAVEPIETRVYANAHTYHINSISVCSDQETFMSVDDLRINLWHVDSNRESWTIVDMKPENMENLTEVITSGTFHPHQCHTFAYSSSKGLIRLCDMRQNALCDTNYKLFYEKFDAEGGSTQSATQAASNRSFFAEIIASIADVKFSHSGNLMCSRDYLWCKVWDLRYETRPLESYAVHEYVRPKLCSLYENDCIFDKFEVCFSYDDRHLLTGSYNNFFRIFDRYSKHDFIYEASRACVELQQPPMGLSGQAAGASHYRKMSPAPPPANSDRQSTPGSADLLQQQQQQQFQIASAYPSILKPKRVTLGSNRNVSGVTSGSGGSGGLITGAMRSGGQPTAGSGGGSNGVSGVGAGGSIFPPLPYPLNEVDSVPIDELDFVHKKILHPTWHPTENLLAIATTNNLFLFTGHSTSALAGGDYYPSGAGSVMSSTSGVSISTTQGGSGTSSGDRSYVGNRSANESSIAGGNRIATTTTSNRSPPRINLRSGRQ